MKEKMLKVKENRIVSYFMPLLIMVIVVLVFAVWTQGRFGRSKNLMMILNQAIILGLVATGAVIIFSTSRISAAMGGSTAMACIIGTYAFLATDSPVAMILGCIGGGLLIMLVTIGLSKILHMDVMILSMIFMTLLMAIQEWVLDGGKILSLDHGTMKSLEKMNLPLILCLVFLAAAAVLFEFSKFGRQLKMIGSNETCARQNGINAQKMLTKAFLLAGVAVGLGSAVILIRSASISQFTANSLNMDAMLAVVLGGTPIRGGTRSKILSGIWGALTVSMLTNGLSMAGIDAIWIQAVRGVFFIVVIALSDKRSEILN